MAAQPAKRAKPTNPVADALAALERCCTPPKDDRSSNAVETAAQCAAEADRLSKKAEQLKAGAEANGKLASDLAAAKVRYKAEYEAIVLVRDDIEKALDGVRDQLCKVIGEDRAGELEDALGELQDCKDDVCKAVDALTGKPRACYDPELCDCDTVTLEDVKGIKAAIEAAVAELTAKFNERLTRDATIKTWLDEVRNEIQAIATEAKKDVTVRLYLRYLLVRQRYEDKLAEGKLLTPAEYEARMIRWLDRLETYACEILPEVSDCLTRREQDVAKATECCKKRTDNLIDDVIASLECEDAPLSEPPCDEDDDDEDDEAQADDGGHAHAEVAADDLDEDW